jgi:hypothetical protein
MSDTAQDDFMAELNRRAEAERQVKQTIITAYEGVVYKHDLTREEVADLRAKFIHVVPFAELPGYFKGEEIIEKPATRALGWAEDSEWALLSGLVPAGEFRTLHSWGYYGLFKPDAAEVYAQMPQEFRADQSLLAFNVRYGVPSGELVLVPRPPEEKSGYHPGIVTVYRLEQN